jgi:hypothetical protein
MGEWTQLINMLAVALVSGVISGLVAYGGLITKLDWLRKDVDNANHDAEKAITLAQEAIHTANRALVLAEQLDKRKS